MNTQDIIAKYGEPGSNQVYCKLPYRMKLAWQKDVTIGRFSCHKTVKDQMEAIFEEVLACYGPYGIEQLGLDLFGGCLNVRRMRGGSRMSIHSWGLAVDLHPAKNRLKWNSDKAVFAQQEYNTFWEIVEKHGGHSLGRVKNYDWMHFQFISIS